MPLTSDDETWIYESPDGGKTVIRRPINNIDPYYKDYKYNNNQYLNHITVGKILFHIFGIMIGIYIFQIFICQHMINLLKLRDLKEIEIWQNGQL